MNNQPTSTLREKVLEQQVVELQRQAAMLHHAHMVTLTTLVWYLGGEVTLSAADYTCAKGVLLTKQVDPLANTITYRTRIVGQDGGGELAQGGILPPNTGNSAARSVLTPEEEATWRKQTIDGHHDETGA